MNPRMNSADVVTVLLAGVLVGGLGCGLAWAGIWLQIRQPWHNGFLLGAGAGLWLGYYFAVGLVQPRRIPNLNAQEVTQVTAVVPDRTEGTIGRFPLPPGELRELARELILPGVRFTQARYKSKYGLQTYTRIRDELLKRGWAIPTYQNSIELTVAGRHVMEWLASPTPRGKM